MRRFAVFLAMIAAGTSPAMATGDILCEAPGRPVTVSIAVGHVPGLAILGANIVVGDTRWSTDQNDEDALPLAVNQGFEDATMLLVDFAAEPAGEIIARLRTINAHESKDYVSGGVLTVTGKGAWVVDCSVRG